MEAGFLLYVKVGESWCATSWHELMISKGSRGDNTLDNSFVLDENWLVRQKKDQRSVRLHRGCAVGGLQILKLTKQC